VYFSAMTKIKTTPFKNRNAMLGELPDIAVPFTALYQSLWHQSHLPNEVLELCRLRLAQLHRCEVEWQRSEMELAPGKKGSLARWDTDEEFSDAERACLAFTEVYAMDAQALTDVQAEAVKSHFDDGGLVLLIEALGIFDGMTRLSLLWQLSDSAVPDTTDGTFQ
jgi:alkylhydroperoxidase family enzyme